MKSIIAHLIPRGLYSFFEPSYTLSELRVNNMHIENSYATYSLSERIELIPLLPQRIIGDSGPSLIKASRNNLHSQ